MIALVRTIYRAVLILLIAAIAYEVGVSPQYGFFVGAGLAAVLFLALLEGD